MFKKLMWVLMLLLALGFGFMSAAWWYSNSGKHTEVRSQGVLQQVRKVFELVTVEGQFSEIYDYKDYYYYDWSILRKKALVKVHAKVSMGYDLSNLEIEVNEKDKVITIGPIPELKIISLDISEEIYDIEQGTFNSFQAEDYNKIKRDIREIIRNKALKSSLPVEAKEQLHVLLDGLRSLVDNYGWKIKVSGDLIDLPAIPTFRN